METWTLVCVILISHIADIKPLTIQLSSGKKFDKQYFLLMILCFSPNEGRILSRKPRPVSRWFQALKPFNPDVWYYLLATSFVLLLIFYLASKIVYQDKKLAKKGLAWFVIKVSLQLIFQKTIQKIFCFSFMKLY